MALFIQFLPNVKLDLDIVQTNILFHDDWAKKLFTCFHYIHIEKNTGGYVFSPNWIIFKLVRDINKTNALTNFHDDWANIVTSRVLTSHVIQLTGTIFELNSHIKETNVLTKCYENWAKNVTSRVFTCFHYIHIEKNAPPTGGYENCPPTPGSHVIELTGTIFKLNSHIKETNVPTNFHEKWAKNVTSRVFTCFHYIHIEKNAPPTGGHVFSPIWTIFELARDINKTNVLTNFHDGWAKIVTSRVFTSHVIELTRTIFKLYSNIKETNFLTKFHENWAKNVTSRVFTYINKTNVLTNFHDDWAKIVTSRVFTRKTAPPTGGHVFQRTGTTFELNQHIIETNILTNDLVFDPARPIVKLDCDFIGTKLLTKFHEDRTINVALRVFTNKCGRTDGRRTKTSHKSSPEQSGELEKKEKIGE
ncbi:hypothetical protein DPMN_112521 [Dreissena polymorpha]|uniref:Uncharacterized protein n=1 Tax=Dreissena polymorpha TaxID=45954 RepID=A0A9D4QPZ0_DREPO|nr:hypothetical protein DPMN_112521 [Dreissena polymorpha]